MKNIFPKLPYLIKVLIVNLYSFKQNKAKYTKEFASALKYYHQIDYSEEEHFNKEKFNKQIKGNSFFTNDNIKEYPIINKNYIKKNYDKIINKNHVSDYLYTSGTTGSGLIFPISKEFNYHQWAIFWKFRNIHQLTQDSWCANIIGKTIFDTDNKKPPFWIKSSIGKQLFFSQYHLNSQTIKLYLNKLIESKIEWLHAYPSVLNDLSTLIKENNLTKLSEQLSIRIITTSSEKLMPYQKENIQSIFSCEIKELYGLTEGVVNIFECEKGTLHIDESYSYVELIKKEGNDQYKIIGTSYHNQAFPLVRYDTNDTCLLYDKSYKCACQRKSRIVKEILGREDDCIVLDDNTKIGRLSHLYKDMLEVKEAQIYQQKKGEATFYIVKDSSYNELSEEKFIQQIKWKLGKNFRYNINYLDSIPRTRQGKLKLVINNIKQREIQ